MIFYNGPTVINSDKTSQIELNSSSSEASNPLNGQNNKIKDGSWNQDEIFKCISYLIYNKEGLKLKLQRRTSRVFKQMSIFIGTRTSVQCRSQNQRLLRKYKNLKTIVTQFKQEYGEDRFQEDYAQIILNPAIKFKTQYEKYIENNSKRVCNACTQTQQIIKEYSKAQICPITPSILEYYPTFNHSVPNWMFVPYYS